MTGLGKGGGIRSGLYSEQRFTNWSPHDPHWSEIEALPPRMRPRVEIARDEETSLGVYDRRLAAGFVRPWTVEDVADVLVIVPGEFLAGLSGVYLLGGTASQRQMKKKVIYGIYARDSVYLFALPERMLTQEWRSSPKPSTAQQYTRFGATFTPRSGGGAILQFDQRSLRLFYLYDVLLHEIGHHLDRHRGAKKGERYANWFAEFQQSRLADHGAGSIEQR